jgi:hypothetical protein
VCSGWKAVHDELMRQLRPNTKITNEAMGLLVRRFPAVTTIDLTQCFSVGDDALRAVIK